MGGRIKHIPPPYGVGGETGYTAPLIVTKRGREGLLDLQETPFSMSAKSLYFIFKTMIDTEGDFEQGREMIKDNYIRFSN